MWTDVRTRVATTGDATPRPAASRAARVPVAAWCLASLAGYALASLVAFPEGSPSPPNRLVALGAVNAAAAPGAVTLWSLPDTPHVCGLSTHEAAYRERVLGHLDAALLGR
jgi:hypothetical protein